MAWIPRFRVSQFLWSVVVVSSVLAVVLVYGRIWQLDTKVERLTTELERLQNREYPGIDFVGANDLVDQTEKNHAWLDDFAGSTGESRMAGGKPLQLEIEEQWNDQPRTYDCRISHQGYNSNFSVDLDPAGHRLTFYEMGMWRGWGYDKPLASSGWIDGVLMYLHLDLPHREMRIATILKRLPASEEPNR